MEGGKDGGRDGGAGEGDRKGQQEKKNYNCNNLGGGKTP